MRAAAGGVRAQRGGRGSCLSAPSQSRSEAEVPPSPFPSPAGSRQSDRELLLFAPRRGASSAALERARRHSRLLDSQSSRGSAGGGSRDSSGDSIRSSMDAVFARAQARQEALDHAKRLERAKRAVSEDAPATDALASLDLGGYLAAACSSSCASAAVFGLGGSHDNSFARDQYASARRAACGTRCLGSATHLCLFVRLRRYASGMGCSTHSGGGEACDSGPGPRERCSTRAKGRSSCAHPSRYRVSQQLVRLRQERGVGKPRRAAPPAAGEELRVARQCARHGRLMRSASTGSRRAFFLDHHFGKDDILTESLFWRSQIFPLVSHFLS